MHFREVEDRCACTALVSTRPKRWASTYAVHSGGALCAFPQFLSLLIVQCLAGFILLYCRVETLEFIGLIKIEIPVLGLLGVAMFVQWGIYFFFFLTKMKVTEIELVNRHANTCFPFGKEENTELGDTPEVTVLALG